MKSSYRAHYLNKYPGGRVHATEDSMDVYCAEGKHRVALRKDGAGMWGCVSEDHGCLDKHDLSPLPEEKCIHRVVGVPGHPDPAKRERIEKVG